MLAHPDRVRLVLALRDGELDVNALSTELGLAHARTSQQLALLRHQGVVDDRRDGRRVFYRLTDVGLVHWLGDGVAFLAAGRRSDEALMAAVAAARERRDG